MAGAHWFWWLLSTACVVWYLAVTVYVTVKGAIEIRSMLARLAADRASPDEKGPGRTS